ncbi:MAG: V-type ATPase 116kDa subunit family protein [Candidatus Diapherotrites archaeon]
MFWPAKVAKVRIFCVKSAFSKVVDCLHDFGNVHLVLPKADALNKVIPEKDFSDVQRLVRLESLVSKYSNVGDGNFTESEASKILKDKSLLEAENKMIELKSLIEKKSLEIEILKEDIKKLRIFERFDFDFSILNLNSVEVVAGFVSKDKRQKVVDFLESNKIVFDLRHYANSFVLIFAVEKGNVSLLDSLTKLGFERMPLPSIVSSPAVEIRKLENKLNGVMRELEVLRNKFNAYEKKWSQKMCVAKEFLDFNEYKSVAFEKSLASSYSCVIDAYVPEKKLAKLVSYLKSSLGNNIFVETFTSKHLEASHEKTPTIFENSKALAPFEFMTRFISIPKSNEIDPTILFTLFFPVFYGMIVGDVIYGLISFLFAKFIFDRVSSESILKPVSAIWMFGSVPSIFFGFLYDEYAGFSHHKLFELFGFKDVFLYSGFERMHYTTLILTASILLGVFTMAMGFLFGFINASRHGHKKHALVKLAWFFIVTFGTILVSTFMFGSFPEYFLFPSALIVSLCAVFVIKEEGIIGAIEIPGVVGNILSFARIIAVGLVGTVIASILNTMALPSAENGFLILFTLPLFIFGHLFNAFLAMFEALVQGARLNVVEFYSKFFEGGGEEFSPFRFRSKYLKLKEVD